MANQTPSLVAHAPGQRASPCYPVHSTLGGRCVYLLDLPYTNAGLAAVEAVPDICRISEHIVDLKSAVLVTGTRPWSWSSESTSWQMSCVNATSRKIVWKSSGAVMKQSDDSAVSRLMHENYKAYFKLGVGMPRFICRTLQEGTLFVDSGWHDPFFNVVVDSDASSPELMRGAEETLAHFMSIKRPFRWKVLREQGRLRAFLRSNGLRAVDQNYTFSSSHALPAMARETQDADDDFFPVSVSDVCERLRWWKPFQSAFNVRPNLQAAICEFNKRASLVKGQNFRNIVFMVHDEPVCSATLFERAGNVFLYDLGVHLGHRGRDYAVRAMRSLHQTANSGGTRQMIFYSTPAGRSLYRRLGYHEHDTFELYGLE